MRFRLPLAFAVLIAFLLVPLLFGPPQPAVRAQSGNGVTDERFARLARGINLPNWFWYGPRSPEQAENVYRPHDFRLIRSLGFTYVRVPIDLGFLLDRDDQDLLRDDALAVLDRALQTMLDHDLAVVVDLHSTDQNYRSNIFSGRLEDEPGFVEIFDAFWASFAAHLSATDPERVFLEVLNEPVYQDNTGAWPPVQARLVATVRTNAPEHTIIVTGAQWSNIETLIALEPLPDPNVIYNFHFYEPHIFTHQGTPWAGGDVAHMRQIPYPSSPQAVEAVIPLLREAAPSDTVESVVGWAQQYGYERWGRDKIAGRINQVVQWSQRHGGLRLMCNEFGVYDFYAPNDDRLQWLRDVRTLFEQHDISWALWNYREDGFGIFDGRELNRAMLEVLGLQTP